MKSCVFCLCYLLPGLFTFAIAYETARSDVDGIIRQFSDVHISEDEALKLIQSVGKDDTVTKEEAAMWAAVANSEKYSNMRRQRAIFQLFDRNASPGMTLGGLADLLAKPTWLKQTDVYCYRGMIRGFRPIRSVPDETIYSIDVLSALHESSIFVRVEDPLTGDSPTVNVFYDTLQGEKTDARSLNISAVVISPKAIEDIACIRHWKVEWSPTSGSPRRWEFQFLDDSTDNYAKQLDFFEIELASLTTDKQVVQLFHLSKPKPDSRIITDTSTLEKRNYLMNRNSNSQKADVELFTRAGITINDRTIYKLIPRALVRQLIELEKSYRGADPWKVNKTRFGVRADGDKFTFYVIEQSLRKKIDCKDKELRSTKSD